MKKEQMVGTRLPNTVVRDVEAIEQVEQADRSTTVRKLLSRAIQDWKLDHYSRLYGSGKLTLARAAREARVSLWEMMDYVKTKKITAQYDLEDFQRDLKTVAASQRPLDNGLQRKCFATLSGWRGSHTRTAARRVGRSRVPS
jgi:predicted HTH domain antitoxin